MTILIQLPLKLNPLLFSPPPSFPPYLPLPPPSPLPPSLLFHPLSFLPPVMWGFLVSAPWGVDRWSPHLHIPPPPSAAAVHTVRSTPLRLLPWGCEEMSSALWLYHNLFISNQNGWCKVEWVVLAERQAAVASRGPELQLQWLSGGGSIYCEGQMRFLGNRQPIPRENNIRSLGHISPHCHSRYSGIYTREIRGEGPFPYIIPEYHIGDAMA